ncbi:MAG: response regulator [Alphaproteobacteria bacterium]|jgi:two-component system chemotaxis response regulator CheY|nr:response regulator [Alphaproteobacteria bacterium]
MKNKILIVDDEAEIRKTIRLQLENTAFEIVEATNGEEAIEALGRENILELNLIICDIRMPKINGIEAIAYFHQNYAGIPIIVLTGYPDVKLAVDLLKEGAADYLTKPVEKAELVAAVNRAVQRRTAFGGTAPQR